MNAEAIINKPTSPKCFDFAESKWASNKKITLLESNYAKRID